MTRSTHDPVRLGIIGLGTQGGTYARFVADGRVPGMTVGAVADTDPAKAERAAAEFGDVPFFTDHLAMMDSGTVDAVITCVPHYLHPQMGVEAIERGIHVLVEKPAGVHALQVRRLNAVAAAHPDVTFGVMFNQPEQPALPPPQGDRRGGGDRPDHPLELDHHDVVASAGVLRAERLARHLGRGGRRRAGEPGPPPARPVAVDLRRAAVGVREGLLRVAA